jgi:class 3 adenylate cyclase
LRLSDFWPGDAIGVSPTIAQHIIIGACASPQVKIRDVDSKALRKEAQVYATQINGAGVVTGVTRIDGNVVVPLDFENQDFCDFLSWDCRQDHAIDPTISPVADQQCSYFSDLNSLIEHCKQRGIMIFVHREDEDTDPTLVLGGEILYQPQNQAFETTFRLLCQTVEDTDKVFHHETDGIRGKATNICVSPNLWAAIAAGIQNAGSPVRRLVSWPISRVFAYVDVSDFSTMPPGQQALVINSIISLVDKGAWNDAVAPRDYEAKLCIGDGYIFVFSNALHAVEFAAQFARLVEVLGAKKLLPVEFHFRMGVHIGDVYSFWDTGRNGWNYIGHGINGGQRVLAAVGKESDDVVYVSEQVRRKIIADSDGTQRFINAIMHMSNRGRKADKHGKMWRVYELNCSGITQLVPALN